MKSYIESSDRGITQTILESDYSFNSLRYTIWFDIELRPLLNGDEYAYRLVMFHNKNWDSYAVKGIGLPCNWEYA